MKRDYSLSIIRLISLCMIIYCHICQGLNLKMAFILNLGVQIFLFLSGYLYGNKESINNVPKWYLKQYKKIIIPYDIVVIIDLLIQYIFFKKIYSLKSILLLLLGLGAFTNPIQNLSHTWFVTYIILMYFITPILYNLKRYCCTTKNFIILNIIICIILELLNQGNLINITSAWVFCYIFGFVYSSYKKNNIKSNVEIFFIILSMIFLLPLLKIDIFNKYNLLLSIKNSYFNWCHTFAGISIFFIFKKIFSNFKNSKNIILDFSDKYSYFIYLTHQIFILFDFGLLNYTSYLPLNILLMFLASIFSGILIYILNYIIKKFINMIILKYRIIFTT